MDNSDKEYAFFKTICQSRFMPITEENLRLAEQLKVKGLKISTHVDSICLDHEIDILSNDVILSALDHTTRALIDTLEVIYETDSTNKSISFAVPGQQYSILLSEYQADGQGRREKKWSSPLAKNIYLSIRFILKNNQFTHFIPLITALSVCQALSKIGVNDCQIKWPNDIYLSGKKIGGILVQNRFNAEKQHDIVVGIGLNVNMQVNTEIDKQWTSLLNCQNKTFDRNKIVSALLTETLDTYNQLSVFDFCQFYQDWLAKDFLKGQQIQVIQETGHYNAIALGLADDGALIVECVEDDCKIKKKIYSAEVSVMPIATLNSDK